MRMTMAAFAALMIASPLAAHPASPAVTDPAPDAAHPASMVALVIPAENGAMNAVIYRAAGEGPHPTLLLLHGFPGNEQNLDLAQAARRAGWNVLTLHYRGSWGSPGSFSFTHAAEDAHTALAFLRDPANVARYGIDPRRIALAGHSMGGFMATDVGADDPGVIGLFLIDPANMGGTGAMLSDPAVAQAWHAEVVGDLPPLAGTSEAALTHEITSQSERFDLRRRIMAYGDRPLAIYGAARGIGAAPNQALIDAAEASGNHHVTGGIWEADHSFSDRRIALSEALVAWLGGLSAAH